jgi:hypothetical protein
MNFLYPTLQELINTFETDRRISDSRKVALNELAMFVRMKIVDEQPALLNVISLSCGHRLRLIIII